MAKNDNIEFGKFHKNIMGTLSFDMKLPNMRKSQDFIVYPASEKTDFIMIQSDTRFGKINMNTGMGLMSQSHANGAYAVHMHIDKLVKFQLTDSQLEKLKEELAKTAGSSVGRSVVISDNSYADKFAKGGEFNDTFSNVLLSFGFTPKRSFAGYKFFVKMKSVKGMDYFATVDLANKSVIVEDEKSKLIYQGFSVASLIKALKDYGFEETGKFAKGGYVEEGENYEYVNTFGIDQKDFEKMVDAYHNPKNVYTGSRRIWSSMAKKYGHNKVTDILEYIEKTHKSHKHYATGGMFGAGHFAEGGKMAERSAIVGANIDESDLEDLQNRGVSIKKMNEMLTSKFPYSFGFTLYPSKDHRLLIPDTDNYYGIEDKELLLTFDKFHGLNYRVMQGDENSYFYFLLEGSDGKYYIGNFGFKDRGDVGKDYVTSFVAFLHKAYNQPFSVAHEVYATGGMFGAGHFASGGELVDKTIDHDGRYLHIVGNHKMLHIHLNNEGREMIIDEKENGRGDEEIMYDLFEDITGNSTLMYHTDLGESGFGMTSSSGVTYDYGYGDDGDLEPLDDNAVVYVDNNSYRRSPVEELLEGRLVMRNSDFMARGGKTASKPTLNGVVGLMEDDNYIDSVNIYGYDSHWDSHKPTAEERKKTKQMLNEDLKTLDGLAVKYKVNYEEATNLPMITLKTILGSPATIDGLKEIVKVKEESQYSIGGKLAGAGIFEEGGKYSKGGLTHE